MSNISRRKFLQAGTTAVLVAAVGVLAGCSGSGSYISLEEFRQIKEGMTYEEVVKIVGGEGKWSNEMTLGSSHYEYYIWYGNGYNGANASICFKDGYVSSKFQIGLE